MKNFRSNCYILLCNPFICYVTCFAVLINTSINHCWLNLHLFWFVRIFHCSTESLFTSYVTQPAIVSEYQKCELLYSTCIPEYLSGAGTLEDTLTLSGTNDVFFFSVCFRARDWFNRCWLLFRSIGVCLHGFQFSFGLTKKHFLLFGLEGSL